MKLSKGEKTGFQAWGEAVGLLITFVSVTAAINAVRQIGKGPGEHILLLRSINKKLSRAVPPVEDLDYNDLL